MLQGSITLHNTSDINALALYSEITGDLDFDAAGVTSISLPNLCKIGGFLGGSLNNAPDLQTLDLPALTFVNAFGKTGFATFPKLTTWSAPKLASVPGGMAVAMGFSAPVPATAFSFPALTTTPQFYVHGAAATITAPALTSCPDINVMGIASTVVHFPVLSSGAAFDCAAFECHADALPAATTLILGGSGASTFGALASVSGTLTVMAGSLGAPNLASVGDISLSGPITGTFALSALKTVSGTFSVRATKLTAISLPSLVSTGSVMLGTPCDNSLYWNPMLAAFAAPLWTHGQISFGDTVFPKCRADVLEAQLGITSSNVKWGEVCALAAGPCP